MTDYLFLYRQPVSDRPAPSPKDMEAMIKRWQDWITEIAGQGKLVSRGNQLGEQGKVLKPGGVITDGPYAEIKETLGGFTVVKATDLDEATTMAHGCPILLAGGSVEIRPMIVQ